MLHCLCLRFLRLAGCAAVFLLQAAGAGAQNSTPVPFNLHAVPTPPPAIPAATPTDKYQPPKVLKAGAVTYPILANLNRIQGLVGVRFFIDETGKVTDAKVVLTSRSLTLDAVIKSRGVMDWTFQPATLDGKPVPSTLDQNFEFRLDPAEQRQFAFARLAARVGIPDPPYPPEALALHPPPHGDCTIGVFWTKAGLVDLINLHQSSGSATLDHAALRFAYLNWHIDPKEIKDPKGEFTKVLTFTPPDDGAGTPPPLAAPTPVSTPVPTATPRPKRPH